MFKYYKDIYEGDIALIQYVPPNWQRFTALLRYCVTCVKTAESTSGGTQSSTRSNRVLYQSWCLMSGLDDGCNFSSTGG